MAGKNFENGPNTFTGLNIEQLFMSYVLIRDDGCWEWIGNRNESNYGVFSCVEAGFKAMLAHRFIYQLKKRLLKRGVVLCHRCDHPWCVNPDHLFEGSRADNNKDAAAKGRAGFRKLTEYQIKMIYENPLKMDRESLAYMYGVTKAHIGLIQRGQVNHYALPAKKRRRIIKRKT